MDSKQNPSMLLDDLAALDPTRRQKAAKELRSVAETFARSGDRHVLRLLAHFLELQIDIPRRALMLSTCRQPVRTKMSRECRQERKIKPLCGESALEESYTEE